MPSSDPCAWGFDSGEPGGRGLWKGGFKAECVSGATELVMKLHLPYQQTHFMMVIGKSGTFSTSLEAPVEVKVFLKIVWFVPVVLGLPCCARCFSSWGWGLPIAGGLFQWIAEPRLSSCRARVSCFAARGIFPAQGLNLCLLCGQVDSFPLSHQGSPIKAFIFQERQSGSSKPP